MTSIPKTFYFVMISDARQVFTFREPQLSFPAALENFEAARDSEYNAALMRVDGGVMTDVTKDAENILAEFRYTTYRPACGLPFFDGYLTIYKRKSALHFICDLETNFQNACGEYSLLREDHEASIFKVTPGTFLDISDIANQWLFEWQKDSLGGIEETPFWLYDEMCSVLSPFERQELEAVINA